MIWFKYLLNEGYFSPENNPAPMQVKGGFQIPYWESLSYLEKLSDQIKEGKNLDACDTIIGIIENVSQNPKDNYHTWYSFLKILQKLPNEKIPKEILKYLPVWLSGQFDSSIQSSEICQKLLPKFLNDNPNPEDIAKAEIILEYLFQISKKEYTEETRLQSERTSYLSKVDLYYLKELFQKGGLISKIAKYCSSEIIINLAKNIKKLLLDFPDGITSEISNDEIKYEVKIYIIDQDLFIQTKLKGNDESKNSSWIRNYEELSDSNLRNQLITILNELNIHYEPTDSHDDPFQRLHFSIKNDLFSAFASTRISELGHEIYSDDGLLEIFTYMFREILDCIIKINPEEGKKILAYIINEKYFDLPFFKRVAIFLIGQNWAMTRDQFWLLVKDSDAAHIFSGYKNEDELYELLNQNQKSLTEEEKQILQEIILHGPQEEVDGKQEKYAEYWQLRWLSALRDISPFKEQYAQLSVSRDITNEHFDNSGKLLWGSGSLSPLLPERILEKTNAEIVDILKDFKGDNNRDTPDTSGLADALGKAAERDPHKFIGEIDLYKEVPYVYVYYLINGLTEAWKKQNDFDWNKLLHFCLVYIKDERFYEDGFKKEHDGVNANSDLVIRSMSHLLSYGTQNDNRAIGPEDLSLVKEILFIFAKHLEPARDIRKGDTDYLTYLLNSTSGMVLRALLDYTLLRGRQVQDDSEIIKWESDVRILFEEKLGQRIIDAFIILGVHFEQFYFLDKEWIVKQIKNLYEIADREWHAFISGFTFSPPPFNKEIYTFFLPHYRRVIDSKVQLNSRQKGFVRHYTAFYFWKFETLSEDGLLYKFLTSASAKQVRELITFVSQQPIYAKGLSETEKKYFDQIIFELWNFIVKMYGDTEDEEEQKNIAALSKFMVFANELDSKYTSLLVKAAKCIHKDYLTFQLLESLVALKDKGDPSITAKFIPEILQVMNFINYISDEDASKITELVVFLFNNGQNEIAEKFCNSMAVNQHLFLRPIYMQYSQNNL